MRPENVYVSICGRFLSMCIVLVDALHAHTHTISATSLTLFCIELSACSLIAYVERNTSSFFSRFSSSCPLLNHIRELSSCSRQRQRYGLHEFCNEFIMDRREVEFWMPLGNLFLAVDGANYSDDGMCCFLSFSRRVSVFNTYHKNFSYKFLSSLYCRWISNFYRRIHIMYTLFWRQHFNTPLRLQNEYNKNIVGRFFFGSCVDLK